VASQLGDQCQMNSAASVSFSGTEPEASEGAFAI
jgi:hypothetical protein